MSEELKPCPFCGGEAWQFIPSDARMANHGCFVECKECGCRTSGEYPNGDTVAVSLLAWSTRALTPKQQCADEMYGKLEKVAELFESICEDDAAKEIRDLLAKSRGEA